MPVYCFDTDVLSASIMPRPPLELVRRLARVPPEDQCMTAITVGELCYGVARRRNAKLASRVQELISGAMIVLPFDHAAGQAYGSLRAHLEAEGRRLDEPDLRIASIVLSRELTLVTRNVRHFGRVPDLRVENWLAA